MKAVLIVLAIVAAAFVAVLVYGANRDEPATTTASGSAPPMRGGELDEDALEDWDPPSLGPVVGSLSKKFVPPIELENPEVSVGGLSTASRTVPPSDDKLRIARLALVAGQSARIIASQPGEKDATLCLCRPHRAIVESDLSGCSDRWIAKQRARNCEDGADQGSLVFKGRGGALVFASGQPARVRVVGREN
jgi:hypothetical protein